VEYLIGIDVGSTNFKAIACRPDGKVLTEARRPGATTYKENGWAELDPMRLWRGVAACIKEVTENLPDDKCIGIGIASNGEDVIVDADGNPVYPTIRWFDTRTARIAASWDKFGLERVYKITGIRPNPVAGITKMQWIKENAPEAYKKARWWISIQGFVGMRLTGEAKTSWCNACRTMAFDLEKRDWSDEILDAAGISRELFPQPVRSGECVGHVTPQAAEETGLPIGTPVYAGGIDYACGTFATGIIKSGQLLDSTGTSEQIVAVVDQPQTAPQYIEDNFTSVTYVVNDKYYMMGQIISSGGIFEWFKNTFPGATFDELVAEAEKMPIGSHGVMMLPYFSGRYTLGNDPAARGAFVGLTRAASRGDFVRALLEGLCFEMKAIIDRTQEISGSKVTSIYAIGGAANSPFWLQMKADVSGLRVYHRKVHESAAFGAAMLAGLGSGIYESPEDAVAKVSEHIPETVYEPDEIHHLTYMKIYEKLYTQMYPALRQLNEGITEMQEKLAKGVSRKNEE
jgi:xylulokinase